MYAYIHLMYNLLEIYYNEKYFQYYSFFLNYMLCNRKFVVLEGMFP
jgi:hypothetical protein